MSNNTQFGRFFSSELFVIQLFMFQAAEETFPRLIIPTIAFSTHALFHFHDRQMFAVVMAGILTAPIRMMGQAVLRFSAPKGSLREDVNISRRPLSPSFIVRLAFSSGGSTSES
jgi:hypothetical protein